MKSIGDIINGKRIVGIGYECADLFYDLEDGTTIYEKNLEKNVDK